MTPSEKECTGCWRMLPVAEFNKRTASPDGLNYRCNDCLQTYRRIHYLANKERAGLAARNWRSANRERYREWQKGYTKKSSARHHEYEILRRYGLTGAKYNELLALQGGRCACCGTNEPGGNFTRFAVDHDHPTGRVRGLLCAKCNLAIGRLGDDLMSLLNAVDYLYRSEEAADRDAESAAVA